MDYKAKWRQFKNLFDWTPVSVDFPVAEYKIYDDANPVLLGYNVSVTYRHHGTKKYFFAHDEEKFGLFSRTRALGRALSFYESKRQQIQIQSR